MDGLLAVHDGQLCLDGLVLQQVSDSIILPFMPIPWKPLSNEYISILVYSGYTLDSATDWPMDWATQPCVQVIEAATTIAGTTVSSCTAVHAPWHISWKAADTTTLWPVPPAWGAGAAATLIDTWTPGGATVYATATTTTTTAQKKSGMSTSVENGKTGHTAATTTTKVVAGAGATPVDDGNGVTVLDSNSTLFWFLVIGLPVLGTLALALCCMAFYYRRAQRRARRRRRRRIRRLKVVEA